MPRIRQWLGDERVVGGCGDAARQSISPAVVNGIPAHVGYLALLGIFAYPPAHYVWRYVAENPSRRDITLPPEEMGWRSDAQFARSLVLLTTLVGLTVFSLTTAASELVRNPLSWTILISLIGAWILYTVAKDYAHGAVEPLLRGVDRTFERTRQPKRFWASLAWNAAMGCLALWFAYILLIESIEGTCYASFSERTPLDVIDACSRMIGREDSRENLARMLSRRGLAYHELNRFDEALLNYSDAISYGSKEPYTYFNRAVILQRSGHYEAAISDYTASIALDPDSESFVRRGALLMYQFRPRRALADFDRALMLDANNLDARALRGISRSLTGDAAGADRDLNAVHAADPKNRVLLQWQAFQKAQGGRPAGAGAVREAGASSGPAM